MVGWAVALAAMVLGSDGRAACAVELFRIARSTNANVVLYEANAVETGGLDPVEPVRASWRMLAEDGHREDLSGLERSLAYGIEVRGHGAQQGTVVALKAEPRRSISIRSVGGCFVALAMIGGRQAILRIVFVEVGGGLLPSIRSVQLIGADLETGEPARETLAPANSSEEASPTSSVAPLEGPRQAPNAPSPRMATGSGLDHRQSDA